MRYVLFALAGYFLGAIRFSYLIPKWLCGVDVTAVSKDKNPGTANAMKYAGIPVGILCLILDMGKGFLPVFLAARFTDVQSFAFAAVVAAPILGHCFPVYHGFHGGKAVAVSFGVLIGLMWDNLIVFGLVFWYLFMCLLRFVRPNEKKERACVLAVRFDGAGVRGHPHGPSRYLYRHPHRLRRGDLPQRLKSCGHGKSASAGRFPRTGAATERLCLIPSDFSRANARLFY